MKVLGFLLGLLLVSWRVGGYDFDEERDPNLDPVFGSSEEGPEDEHVGESSEEETSSERLPDDMLAPDSLLPDTSEFTIKLNWIIDEILKGARAAFTHDGELTIKLKDVDKPWGGLLKGRFSATGGYFRNPGSLQRTGDAEVSVQGGSAFVQASLGLAEVEAGFTSYHLDLANIHQAGNITATVADNSLGLKLTLTYSPTCKVHLDYVEFKKLDGIKFKITGLGAFQSLIDTISSWLINNFEGTLKTVVNQKLYEKLTTEVEKASIKICNVIPHI